MGAVQTVPVSVSHRKPPHSRRQAELDAPSPGTLLPDGTRLPDGRLSNARRPNRAQYYQPQREPGEQPFKDPVARVLDNVLAAASDETAVNSGRASNSSADDHFRRGLREAFDAIDRNGNGELDFVECKSAMQRAGHAVTDSEVQLFMSQADLDRNGVIVFEEFVALMRAKMSDDLMTDKACLEDVFRVLDASGDGVLTSEELRSFFRGLSTDDFEPPSESFLDELLAGVDANGDGKVDYREFVVGSHPHQPARTHL